MNDMPCFTTFLERATDAGTRPWPPLPEADRIDRAEAVATEARSIMRAALGLARDVGPDGTVRAIRLDRELASDVIDQEGVIEELVRLACARATDACTVTDAQIAAVVERAVRAAVERLADYRVPA